MKMLFVYFSWGYPNFVYFFAHLPLAVALPGLTFYLKYCLKSTKRREKSLRLVYVSNVDYFISLSQARNQLTVFGRLYITAKMCTEGKKTNHVWFEQFLPGPSQKRKWKSSLASQFWEELKLLEGIWISMLLSLVKLRSLVSLLQPLLVLILTLTGSLKSILLDIISTSICVFCTILGLPCAIDFAFNVLWPWDVIEIMEGN